MPRNAGEIPLDLRRITRVIREQAHELLTGAAREGTIPLGSLLAFADVLLSADVESRDAGRLALAVARGELVQARRLAVDLAGRVATAARTVREVGT